MEVPAREAAVHGLSASAILEVAEGLRWSDPQLSVALAEHVARAVGDDHRVRAAAERSAVLALGQLDRPAEVVVRALPHLREAERVARAEDAAPLRCEVALAAAQCGAVDAAETLLEPLAGGRALPGAVRADALVAWTAARAGRGDVAGVDAAARQVADLVEGDGAEGTDQIRRVALQRSRARARRAAGDVAGAAAVLLAVDPAPTAADGGRQSALLVADVVEVLGELGRSAEARELGVPSLAAEPGPTTALALGRLRCGLARAVHLPAGDLDAAERLAGEASEDLAARGQLAELAGAFEVLAAVAEARGDPQGLRRYLRRAHEHAIAAHEEVARARVALAAALARDEDRIPTGSQSRDRHAPESDGRPDATAAVERPADSATQRRHRRASEDEADRGGDPAPAASAPPAPTAPSHAAPVDVPEDAPPSSNGTSAGLTLWEELDQRFGPDVGASIGEALAREARPAADVAEPEHVPEPEPVPETAWVREAGRRRRTRYREDSEPAGLLAAALAARAADGGAPVAADERAATGADRDAAPADPGAAGGDLPEGPRTDPAAGTWAGVPSDAPSDAPSDVPVGTATDVPAPWWVDATRIDPADPLGTTTAPEFVPGTRGIDPTATGHDVDDAAASRSRRLARARAPWEVPESLLSRRSEPEGGDRSNGHDDGRDRDGGESRRTPPREPDPATATVPAPSGRAAGQAEESASSERDRPAAPGGADDELARELALTLVDLLAEYQDPDVPLGGPRTPTPVGPAGGRSAPRPSRSTTNGSTPRRSSPGGEGSGVPAARHPDAPDATPRLADLLADAMDVYHRTGADPASADDRRARR